MSGLGRFRWRQRAAFESANDFCPNIGDGACLTIAFYNLHAPQTVTNMLQKAMVKHALRRCSRLVRFWRKFHENDIVSNLSDAVPGDDDIAVSAEHSAESGRAGEDQCGDLTAGTVEFHIDGTAKAFAGTDIDDFFLTKVDDTHGNTPFLTVYENRTNKKNTAVHVLAESDQ